MLDVYKKTHEDNSLRRCEVTTSEIQTGSWLNIIAPKPNDIPKLAQELNIPEYFIIDSLDINERPRVEIEDEGILIIYRIPVYEEKENESTFYTIPLGIILKKDYIITVCQKPTEILYEFINGNVKDFYTSKRSRFILQIISISLKYYLNYIKEIDKRIYEVEQEFYRDMKDDTLIKLMRLERSLHIFLTSLRGNELLLEKIQKAKIIRMYEEDEDILDDIIIENKQAIEMASVFVYNIKSLSDYFSSIISNRLNSVMKFLTSVTIILMFPTLVASLYGMNVNLPLQNHPFAFWIILIISLVGTSIVTIYFIKKRWL